MSDSTSVIFDALTKGNYNTWRIHAKALLVVRQLWDYVKEDKAFISADSDIRELWMKQDEIAKSELILHISSSLLPLVEDCTTSREVWLKLANVYSSKGEEHEDSIENSDCDDEDEIINDIEISVAEFFEIINDLSEEKIMEHKKSLSTTFTDNLFSQLKINNIMKLPNKTIIVNTVSDFLDVVGKLSKIEIDEWKTELSDKLIDSLLVKFNMNLHKNDNDETKGKADTAQTRDNDTAGGGKKENDQLSSRLMSSDARDIVENQSEMIHEDKITVINEQFPSDFLWKLSRLQQQFYDERSPCELLGREGHENPMSPLAGLYTPPSTPTPKKTRKCGVCRKEGHNRTTCPLNKPVAPPSKYTAAIPKIPKRSSSKSTATNPKTPKRRNKCGVCREKGHNRTTCPLNKPAASVPEVTTIAPKTPKRSYKCGGCGNEGHNIRSCPWIFSETSLPKPAAIRTPVRSYTCGLCGREGHNKTTCPRNFVTATARTRTAHRCGNCGGKGHNSRTCGRRQTSSSSYYTAQSYSY